MLNFGNWPQPVFPANGIAVPVTLLTNISAVTPFPSPQQPIYVEEGEEFTMYMQMYDYAIPVADAPPGTTCLTRSPTLEYSEFWNEPSTAFGMKGSISGPSALRLGKRL